ncbi:MAG: VOC family protein [Alphaproteobacteria bacterium]|jgi:catechol 2,3-dioxygenase-like lactoylglutathione lyase family enzyme|nr:VOC family protein [Alphaproteobacteria bacterium]
MPDERNIDHVVIAVPDLAAAAARYRDLGFTLTPKASHPDHMGTSNQLVQFAGRNFIELVTLDRPDTVVTTPDRFSFGAHVGAFAEKGGGMVALVLASDDARADAARLETGGLETYPVFDFERHATLPDGREVTVAFSLAFATSPEMPDIAFYFCQHHYPKNFWKPAYQKHANGAKGIATVHMLAEDPERHRGFLEILTKAEASATPDGIRFGETLAVHRAAGQIPSFARLTISVAGDTPQRVDDASGISIDWQA